MQHMKLLTFFMYAYVQQPFLGHFAFLTLDKGKDDVFRKLLYFEVKFQHCFQQSLTKLSNSYFAKLHVILKFLCQVKCLQYKQFS